jgi:ketosteroid isomerase-like protein
MTSVLEDKFAIEELISRYNQSLDQGDYAAWLDCWTDDAVLDGLGRYLVGKAEIKGFADAYEGGIRQRLHALKHYTVNILSTIEGDTATSSSYLQLINTTDKGVQTRFTGRYEDALRRTSGQWRFSRRKLHQDMPPPLKAQADITPAAPS